MYAVKPDMFAKYLAMAANDGKGLFENSILKPDAKAVMKKLDPTNGLAAVNEAYAIRGKTIGCANTQPTNENDGLNNDAPNNNNNESDKKAEIIKSASSGKSRARSIKSLPGMLGSKSKKTVKPNSNDSEQKEPATPDDNDGGPGDGLG